MQLTLSISSPEKRSFSFIFSLSISPLSICLYLLAKPCFPFFFRLSVSPLFSFLHHTCLALHRSAILPLSFCHAHVHKVQLNHIYNEINSQPSLILNMQNMDIRTYNTRIYSATVQHTGVGLTQARPNYACRVHRYTHPRS